MNITKYGRSKINFDNVNHNYFFFNLSITFLKKKKKATQNGLDLVPVMRDTNTVNLMLL